MATLKDYYNTEGVLTSSAPVNTGISRAQVFQASSSYTCDSVRLYMTRDNEDPTGITVTVSIRATTTDENGYIPTGSNLTNLEATIDLSDITHSVTGWYTFDFTGAILTSGTRYAIVCVCTGDSSHDVIWLAENTDVYANGNFCNDVDADDTWASVATWDGGFEVYGDDVTYEDVSGTIAGSSSVSGALTVDTIVDISGTINGVSSIVGAAGVGSSPNIIISPDWQTTSFENARRLVIAGNDSIYYEDI